MKWRLTRGWHFATISHITIIHNTQLVLYCGGNRGTCPHNPETAGAKCLFAPAIICQVYQLVDSQTSISLYSWLPGLIAEMQESSPEEPKMHQNSLWPGLLPRPHWGSLQHSPDPLAGGRGLTAPYPRTPPSAQPHRLRASTLQALPPQCWLISDATSAFHHVWLAVSCSWTAFGAHCWINDTWMKSSSTFMCAIWSCSQLYFFIWFSSSSSLVCTYWS